MQSHTLAPAKTKPKFIEFVPGDTGAGLPAPLFEDPRTYTPAANSRGHVHFWGLYPYGDPTGKHLDDPDWTNSAILDGMSAMKRTMQFQTQYAPICQNGLKYPQEQFLDVFMERRREELLIMDIRERVKQDVILYIRMPMIKDRQGRDRIWRRIRVSAGMRLDVVQDKVLAPVMGWVRNLHCWVFTRFRDGTLFGPENSNSVDKMHHHGVGYTYMPSSEYLLAHLFDREGDYFGYFYDFGDHWDHEVLVEKILSPEESTGKVEILEGKGECPGENMHGNYNYAPDVMDKWQRASEYEKTKIRREIFEQPNYKTYPSSPAAFEPLGFNIDWARARLAAALESHNSASTGAVQYNVLLQPDSAERLKDMQKLNLKRGQKIEQTPIGEGKVRQEVVNLRRDSVRTGGALCNACGNPNGPLKACSACKDAKYCSVDCQKGHWRRHKKMCKTRKVN